MTTLLPWTILFPQSPTFAPSIMSDPSITVASLGLFILDTFEWRSAETADDPADSNPTTSPAAASTTLLKRDEGVIGGGGTYAMIGARIWLRPNRIGILVDRGNDWDSRVEAKLNEFGKDMWIYRDKEGETTKALNLYTGEHRGERFSRISHFSSRARRGLSARCNRLVLTAAY